MHHDPPPRRGRCHRCARPPALGARAPIPGNLPPVTLPISALGSTQPLHQQSRKHPLGGCWEDDNSAVRGEAALKLWKSPHDYGTGGASRSGAPSRAPTRRAQSGAEARAARRGPRPRARAARTGAACRNRERWRCAGKAPRGRAPRRARNRWVTERTPEKPQTSKAFGPGGSRHEAARVHQPRGGGRECPAPPRGSRDGRKPEVKAWAVGAWRQGGRPSLGPCGERWGRGGCRPPRDVLKRPVPTLTCRRLLEGAPVQRCVRACKGDAS
jgi:hypothetical protein